MLDEIIIRPIISEDNLVISSIIKNRIIEFDGDRPGTAFHDKTLLNMFEAYQQEKQVYYVAILNEKIVGGCGIAQLDTDNKAICELQKMYISPKVRGKKIGKKKLLDACQDFASLSDNKQCYLETFSTMQDAQNLYKKNGFLFIEKPIGNTGHDACNTWLLKDLNL